jgi:CheY-like chemotaxis protein
MPKILIIDDEQPLRDEVSDWLEFEGYQVALLGQQASSIMVQALLSHFLTPRGPVQRNAF